MSGILDEIKKERERFVAFAFAAAEIFLELDSDSQILFGGGATERITPKKEAGLVGKNIKDVIDNDDYEVFRALTLHLEHKGRIGPLPIRFITDQGRSLALRVFALGMPGPDARVFLALRAAPLGAGGAVIASAHEETGLLTQESFMELATKTMADSSSSSGLYMTTVEVDGLAGVQKDLGPKHMKGLLKQIAAHLRTLSIDGQAAGQISDKHFAFLHRTKMDGEHLSRSLGELDKNVSLKSTYVTLAADTTEASEDQILRTLSYILTKFCENPKNVNFDTLSSAFDDMAASAQQRVTSMRNMIDTGNFKMAFQPVVSLQTGDILHNEVLSRFEGNAEDNSPLEIIKFAEDVGIIEEFDIALCRKAIDYVRKLKKLGTPLSLAMNISGKTLDSGRFVEPLVNTLIEAKDVSRALMLELTETSAVQNLEKVEAILNDLKVAGYKICLDDFGAGASGYQYLRAFNVDFVKIDGTYVKDMHKKDYKPTFLMSIVRLCDDLGIRSIGEHVETKFQADFLKSLGVHYGQGFYFGKPDFTPRTN